ncbi:osteocrin [Lepisosteus oculatus]|uniref:Osteocrin n=1 Tax=Lepisosteus oculatus TaxID=7918 RepID=W5MSY8_LEPOC|nr:PREDICTED: osteocrin [Lepisosteus oculatus]
MLGCRCILLPCLFAVTLLHWSKGILQLAEGAPEFLDSSLVEAADSRSLSSDEKSSNDLAAKLLLLDELVNLENDVIETKKKRSFPGFGSPLDRLSVNNMELKGKQRKVVDLPRRRLNVPIDRIAMNRIPNSRG